MVTINADSPGVWIATVRSAVPDRVRERLVVKLGIVFVVVVVVLAADGGDDSGV